MNSSERPRNVSKLMWTFSFPNLASSLLINIVQFATYDLYAYGYQLDTLLTGFAISMGYLTIAASQFFFGWISDKWYTRWGRRKPWVIILAPIAVVSFIAVLLPNLFLTNPTNDTLLGWLLLWNVLFQMSYAVTTPYGAWMAELFTVGERPRTSQISSTFKMIGTGTFTVFSFLILSSFTDQLKAHPGVLPPEPIWSIYLWTCIIFGTIFIAFFYLAAFLMPTEAPPKTKPNLLKNLRNILTNKNFLFSVTLNGIASVSWTIIGTTMLPYVQTVLAFGMLQYALAGATLLIGVFIFLYVWRKILARKGKKNGLLLLFTIGPAVLSCSLLGLIPLSATTALIFGLLFILGISICLGGWYLIAGMWFADLAEDDEKRTGEMKAGVYVGFPSIMLNLFQSLGPIILGALNTITYTIPGATVPIGIVLWGPVCAAFLILAFFFGKRFIQWGFEWEKEPKRESVEQKL